MRWARLMDLMNNRSDSNPQLSAPVRVTPTVSTFAIERGMFPPGVAPESTASVRRYADPPAGYRLDTLDDASVMLRVKAGDDGAFDYLVTKYRRPMVSFMYRTTHNVPVAEELAQEVFLRVYRSREGYKADAKFTTWLYRIATNLAVNYARDTRHERNEVTVSLDEPNTETGLTADVADGRPSVEQSILRRERLAAIRKEIESLPERQKLAVIMHKYQNMDYRQIADVLKLSESATKSLLFRAYETLRVKLEKFL